MTMLLGYTFQVVSYPITPVPTTTEVNFNGDGILVFEPDQYAAHVSCCRP